MSGVGKPGYKETAVGWIPVEWDCAELGGYIDLLTGAPFKSELFSTTAGKPLIRIRDLLRSYSDTGYVGEYEDRYLINAGDVLVGMDGEFHVVRWKGPQSLLNQRVLKISVKPTLAHLGFVFFLVSGAIGSIQEGISATTVKHLSTKDLQKLVAAIPPLPEQQKIAAILTAVDDKLDLIARQISATQTLKQGLMQTLFTRGAGTQDAQGRWHPHTEFQDTELGRIPVGWRVGHLQDYIAALRSGVSVNAEDRIHGDGEVGVLKVSCVLHGKFYPQGHKTVPPEEVARVAEPVLQGRIIISRANTPALVGESAYVDRAWPDLFLPDKLWQTEASDLPHSVKWLAFYLQSPFVRQEISKAATGTSGSMKNIAKPALLNIAMPLVPVAEQEYVAELLSSVVDKLTTLTTQRTHYQSLKRGLMQKLLTGQWRVRVDAATLAPVNEEAPA